MPIAKRKLGRTGIDVTVLGFGGAPLGDIYEQLDDATAIATVEAAAAAGITHFDAAPMYGQGIAEHRIGTALRRLPRGGFTVSTKVGRLMVPAPNGRTKTTRYVGGLSFDVVHDYSYDAAMRSHEHSLLRFGLPKVDILLIHDADAWSHGPELGEQHYRTAMSGAYKALEKLRDEGVIKGIGIGTNDPAFAARFLQDGDFDCMLLAGRYFVVGATGTRGGFATRSEEKCGCAAGRRFQLRHSRNRPGRRRQVQLCGSATCDSGKGPRDRPGRGCSRRVAAGSRVALLFGWTSSGVARAGRGHTG